MSRFARRAAVLFAASFGSAACQLLVGLERGDREPAIAAEADADAAPTGDAAEAGCTNVPVFTNDFDGLDGAAPGTFGFESRVLVSPSSTVSVADEEYESAPHSWRITGDETSDVNVGFLQRTGVALLGSSLSLRVRIQEDTDAGAERLYLLAAVSDSDPGSATGRGAALALGFSQNRLRAGIIENIENPMIRATFDGGAPLAGIFDPTTSRILVTIRFEEKCPIDNDIGDGGGLVAVFYAGQTVQAGGCLALGGKLNPASEGALLIGLRTTDKGAPVTVWYDDIEIRGCRESLRDR